MSYVLSNANRWYCAIESSYGKVPSITADNRIPALKMSARQQFEKSVRRDKTGGRTYAGTPPGGRRRTEFSLATYLTAWTNRQALPAYGPLFYAAMGATPMIAAGATVASNSGTHLAYSAPHGLVPNQAVSAGNEIRFVAGVIDATNVTLSAPFSTMLVVGATTNPTVTFLLEDELPSCSIFDYWAPSTALQRIISGAGVNEFSLAINGDFQEFRFAGVAQDIVDSASFTNGMGQLPAFPGEPPLTEYQPSIVPGALGQIWMGVEPNQFYTVTGGQLRLDNDLEVRANEFGSSVPQSLAPGIRNVNFDFSLFEQDDQATMELYQAARQQSTIPVMLQLGQSAGQLFGAYLPAVMPQIPELEDSHRLVQWKVSGSRAQGLGNDELVVAFA